MLYVHQDCFLLWNGIHKFGILAETHNKYNLNVVKEIEVTDAYLGLDRETINCQNKESLQDCQTIFYHETILAKCGCLPFNLWNNNNKV